MNKSPKDKPKGPKPKPQFHGLLQQPGHHGPAGHRPPTPGPKVNHGPPFTSYGHREQTRQQPTAGGKTIDKIAGFNTHPMTQPAPPKIHHKETDPNIWVRVETVASSSPNTSYGHREHDPPQNNAGKFLDRNKEITRILEHNGRDLAVTDLVAPEFGNGTQKVFNKHGSSISDRVVADSPQGTSAHPQIELVVEKGLLFRPSKTRPRPDKNTFANANNFGPANFRNQWTVELGNYRDDEVTFILEGFNLLVEGNQSLARGQSKTTSEVIELPSSLDIDRLRVFRNAQTGTLTVGYLRLTQN